MTSAEAGADPNDPGFDLVAWEESRRRQRQEAATAQGRRDAAWHSRGSSSLAGETMSQYLT